MRTPRRTQTQMRATEFFAGEHRVPLVASTGAAQRLEALGLVAWPLSAVTGSQWEREEPIALASGSGVVSCQSRRPERRWDRQCRRGLFCSVQQCHH